MNGEIGFVPGSQTVTIDEDGSRTGKHGPSCSKMREKVNQGYCYKLMIESSKITENYPRKCFLPQERETRVKCNPAG